MAISSRSKPYPVILEDAWQAHLAPKPEDAPTVISLFAGCGGSSLGYSMAGFRELLAVEWDNNAVESFRLNFPDIPVYHGDICKLSVEECLEMTGLQPGELDVLDGSPPCQGFSTAGKRNFDDERNQLFREYVRLLEGLQPKVLIMENVSGMVKGKMKLIFADILQALKGAGYRVSARLMNAMYFNVPQSRARMIFVGVRGDLGIEPSHPKAQAKPITIANAIGDMQTAAPYLSGKVRLAIECNSAYRRKWKDSWAVCPTLQAARALLVLDRGQVRDMCPDEAASLASFPSSFHFPVPTDAQKCIGNSVPPLFMRAIAEHVRAHILTPERA